MAPWSFVFTTLCLVLPLGLVQGYWKVMLNGYNWTVEDVGASSSGTRALGSVPGSVYTALMDSGVINYPLYRDNDVQLAWIGETDWAYSRNFTLAPLTTSEPRAFLICEGLDTVATIEINGVEVGRSDNMFVQYVFDVTDAVQEGDNLIKVTLKSPVNEAKARTAGSSYLIPPECPQAVQNGQCNVNQLRKEQCSFSWDWGPSFPTVGIWKDIYIDSITSAALLDVAIHEEKVNNQWQIVVEILLDVIEDSVVTGEVAVIISRLNIDYRENVSVSEGNNTYKFVVKIPETTDVPLWWPNGYGDQPVFDTSIIFSSGVDHYTKNYKIGFRTVELVQDPVSSSTDQGSSFYFRVNGVPIFLKGSNWIPAESFKEKETTQRLRYLLESAAKVGINSLRVWGGGVYESDAFYDLCDELGIMVWQDMMFSVAMYPTYPEFLESVSTEVTQQVQRLKNHPSIIIWAGNNENEAALRQNWFGTSSDYQQYYNDYVKLYVDTVGTIVQQEDTTRPYVVSSPSNGLYSDGDPYVSQDPGNELYGDVHFYDYSVDQWDANSFRIPRMASEYGVQAWCNNESLASVFEAQDYRIDSAMASHRQHHGNGNLEMATEVNLHMHLPSNQDDAEKFADFIFLTQVNQAMSIRTQTEHYRRYQNRLLSDGRGLTMGALYWQLNDIWQAPTWSSIDYEGHWKMLHYYAKNFFNRLLVSPYLQDPDTLDVYVVVDEIPIREVRNAADNSLSFEILTSIDDRGDIPTSEFQSLLDTAAAITSGTITMSIYNYNSFTALQSWDISYSLTSTATSVLTRKVSDLLSESGCPSKETCFLYFKATNQSDSSSLIETWLPLAYPKDSTLPPAQITIASVSASIDPSKTFDIDVSSDAVALFVWLSSGNIKGYFSNNGFPMVSPSRTIQFFADEYVSEADLVAQLTVRSLVDVPTDEAITPDAIIG